MMETDTKEIELNIFHSITQVFKVLGEFSEFYMNHSWPNDLITEEEISQVLQFTKFIEEFLLKFDKSKSLGKLNEMYVLWCTQKNIYTDISDVNTFLNISDLLTEKFLMAEINTDTLDRFLVQYIKFFDNNRLNNVLKNVLLKCISTKSIENNVLEMKSNVNLTSELFLYDLSTIKDEITQRNIVIEMLESNSDLQGNVIILFKTILLNQNEHIKCKEIVEKCILNKMKTKDKNSWSFWNCILKQVDKILLKDVCRSFKSINKEILYFLINCSAHMERDLGDWTNNKKTSLCSNLLYVDLKEIVKVFVEDIYLKNILLATIGRSSSNIVFWNYILKDLETLYSINSVDSFCDDDIFVD